MKKIDEKYFENPEQYIPKGFYCYTYINNKSETCPFWDKDLTKPIQENGYCYYLKQGDWDINAEGGEITNMKTGETFKLDYFPFGGLLWDMCKECGINEDDD